MNHPTTRRSRAKPSRVRPSRLPAGHAAALRRPRRALQPRRTRRRRARRSGWSGSGARSARCNRCSDTANAARARTFPPNSNRIGARSCFGRRDSASWLAAGAANAARVNDGPSLQLNVAAMSVGRRLIFVPTTLRGRAFRVPGAGLEPAWPCGRGILSPLRIPVSPPGRAAMAKDTSWRSPSRSVARSAPPVLNACGPAVPKTKGQRAAGIRRPCALFTGTAPNDRDRPHPAAVPTSRRLS